jgi:hypothetical protein
MLALLSTEGALAIAEVYAVSMDTVIFHPHARTQLSAGVHM